MIIICFQGGLGNQMFQYAYYKEIKYLYPNVKVVADISDYRFTHCIRNYELEAAFDIIMPMARDYDVFRMTDKVPGYEKLTVIRRKIDRNVVRFLHIRKEKVHPRHIRLLNEARKDFDPNQNYYLEGFWNNEDAFSDVKDAVIKDFRTKIDNSRSDRVKGESYIHGWAKMNTVGVHVRRTDYLIETGYVNLSLEYYRKAIKLLETKVENPVYIFFSDDTEYVKTNFAWVKNKYIISENIGVNSYKDLLLMGDCKHNIIANSTFSYWGAYINANPDKIVIAPNKYKVNEERALAADGWLLVSV